MKMVEDFGILIVVSSLFYANGFDRGNQRAMETDEAEGFQRAIGKPFGRLRRGGFPLPQSRIIRERENNICQDGKSQKGASPPFSPPIAEGGKSVYVVYSLSHATFTVPSGPFLCFAMMISPTFLSAVSGS